jgi:hypothetical protein
VGLKQPGREADHSPPISAEVKKTWIYTTILPIRLHDVVLNYLGTGTAFIFIRDTRKYFDHERKSDIKILTPEYEKQFLECCLYFSVYMYVQYICIMYVGLLLASTRTV